MPRPASSTSNFTSDRHVLYTGWVLGTMRKHLGAEGAKPVIDDDGGITPFVDLRFGPVSIRLSIPTPPEDWDQFAPIPDVATVPSKPGGAIGSVIPS